MCIIDLEYPASWPSDVLAYLRAHYDVFFGWENDRGNFSTSPEQYDEAIRGLKSVLKKYSLTGLHCTRLTEEEIKNIIANGMQLPDVALLDQRIRTIEISGQITPAIAERLRAKNQAHESSRAHIIWFCFFPPHIEGEWGIERFFRSWGGEALYNSHEDDPETGPVLRSIGVPCLIKADVPISRLGFVTGLAMKVAKRFLASHGVHIADSLDYEGRTKCKIPAENIRQIIRHPESDFVTLTKCDTWRTPIG